MTKRFLSLTPLQKAVVDDNVSLIKELQASQLTEESGDSQFTALELALLLGRKRCQELLESNTPSSLKKNEREFEKRFYVTYRQFLRFPSYETIEEVVRDCPYLFRLEWLWGGAGQLEVECKEKMLAGFFANTNVQWINPHIGYGLFAGVDFPEKAFIGEYTGLVRKINRFDPQLNGYCFHYPARVWSSNYFVIDSLHEGNLSRFINHSEKPNLQPLWIFDRGIRHLIFLSNQPIAKGTELTFNYGGRKFFKTD